MGEDTDITKRGAQISIISQTDFRDTADFLPEVKDRKNRFGEVIRDNLLKIANFADNVTETY